jgi:outer membrane protein assembly factor BamE
MSPYRIEIQQGNFISQETASRLKLGMSKDQVRFVLGTPLITDTFHADRWDYVFRRQKANSRDLEQRRLAVFFEDGKLTRIEGDMKLEAGMDAAGATMPEAKPDAQKPEAQLSPAPVTLPESGPAVHTASDAGMQAPVPQNPAAAPVPPTDTPPQ